VKSVRLLGDFPVLGRRLQVVGDVDSFDQKQPALRLDLAPRL